MGLLHINSWMMYDNLSHTRLLRTPPMKHEEKVRPDQIRWGQSANPTPQICKLLVVENDRKFWCPAFWLIVRIRGKSLGVHQTQRHDWATNRHRRGGSMDVMCSNTINMHFCSEIEPAILRLIRAMWFPHFPHSLLKSEHGKQSAPLRSFHCVSPLNGLW